jgi:hypothetical protein
MSADVVAVIAKQAEDEARASKRRAVLSHVTHYVLGVGGAIAAATAGALAALGESDEVAVIAGGVGALFASIVTFMNPLKRAAFHYGQLADYEDLTLEAKGAGRRDPAELRKSLTELRRRTAKDLTGK